MSQKCGDLLHLHELTAGGPKPLGLEKRGGENERLIVPEANSVSHRRVPIREELLELVGLEDIGNGEIATVL